MTANCHVTCTHVAEAADLKYLGCRAIRHPSTKLGKQIAHFRRCLPLNDFTEGKFLAVPVRSFAAFAGPIPASPIPKGSERRLYTFGAGVFDALRFATTHARPSAESIRVSLAADNLDLHFAEQLLAFHKRQPDLFRRQVGDWPSNRANVVGDRRVAIRRQLKADRPFHWVSLPCQQAPILPWRPHIRSTPLTSLPSAAIRKSSHAYPGAREYSWQPGIDVSSLI